MRQYAIQREKERVQSPSLLGLVAAALTKTSRGWVAKAMETVKGLRARKLQPCLKLRLREKMEERQWWKWEAKWMIVDEERENAAGVILAVDICPALFYLLSTKAPTQLVWLGCPLLRCDFSTSLPPRFCCNLLYTPRARPKLISASN